MMQLKNILKLTLIPLTLISLSLVGCEQTIDGLIATKPGDGPVVTWDLLAKPLPEIPLPNDVATRQDLDSPTGRRINVSLIAPTQMERTVREEFSRMDGWGTFAPISVGFESPIEPLDIRVRHSDDDFSNDAVYLVDLKDGSLIPLDLGRGNFPIALNKTDRYYDNDPRVHGSNIFFETYDEDLNKNGILDPGEDTNGDGVLGVPNTADPSKPMYGLPPHFDRAPPGDEGNDVYRDLLGYYERATNSLIIRPVVPMKQRHEYAVVLTNRIRDPKGKPIRSPFPFVHHASQTEQLRPLLGFLEDGTIPGLKADQVAFAWAFTTQSVTKDLEAIREGLYGRGPLGWLSEDFPAVLEPVQTLASAVDEPVLDNPVYPLVSQAVADKHNDGNPYYLKASYLADSALEMLDLVGGIGAVGDADIDSLLETLSFVDYLVIGAYRSPDFMDDPDRPYTDSVFRIQADTGLAQVWERPSGWQDTEYESLYSQLLMDENAGTKKREARFAIRDRISFILVVPKPQPERGIEAPFPVSLHAHGANSSRDEAVLFGGYLARFGIATIAINGYTHGIDFGAEINAILPAFLEGKGMAPLGTALLAGRSRDIDMDGTEESGGDFWVADTFHARDAVRQTVVDWFQMVRVLRSFGTYRMEGITGPDGKPALAGDFNGDGVIDVGGPVVLLPDGTAPRGADIYMEGISLGGITTSVVSALEPEVVAAVAISGGGGMGDIAARTELGQVVHNVFPDVMGPLFVVEPAAEGGGINFTQYVGGGMSLTKLKLNSQPIPAQPGDRLELVNLNAANGTKTERDSAILSANSTARLQVGGDGPKYLDHSPFRAADGSKPRVRVAACESESRRQKAIDEVAVAQFGDCLELRVWRGDKLVHVFDRLGHDVDFRGKIYEANSPLITFASGFGFKRQTPDFRRFLLLAQMILEPADPVNYARHYHKEPLPAREGKPLPILMIPSAGDMAVPIPTAYSLGRASGVLDYVYDESKHAAWGMSPNDVAIKTGALESVYKLRYFEPVANLINNHGNPEDLSSDDLAALTRDWRPEEKERLKLIRCVDPSHCAAPILPDLFNAAYDPDTDTFLDSTTKYFRNYGGAPRLKTPLTPVTRQKFKTKDHDGSKREVISGMLAIYPEVYGMHVFEFPSPAADFDIGTYVINMTGAYLYNRGEKIISDICLHRDGWDRRKSDAGAQRVPACDVIPEAAP